MICECKTLVKEGLQSSVHLPVRVEPSFQKSAQYPSLFSITCVDFSCNSVKKEDSKYKKKVTQTGGGPLPSPPNFSEEHEMLCEALPGEMKMGQNVFDTYIVRTSEYD